MYAFKNTFEQVLQGLSGVLVTGHSEQAHLENFECVLHRLDEYGLKLKKSKCEIIHTSVEYHVIDKEGVHKATCKVDQILDMPTPNDVTSLRSFLGVLNYYRHFIPNLKLKRAINHSSGQAK